MNVLGPLCYNLITVVNCYSVYSSSFDGEFSSSLVQVTSDGFLLMAMASILPSSSMISQLTNVHTHFVTWFWAMAPHNQ